MKFNECNDFYQNLSESLKDPRRKALYEKSEVFLEDFETIMFDQYDVEGIYIVDDFFNKKIFSPEKIPLYWKMSKKNFEEFVDSREAEFLTDSFNMYVQRNDELFHYNNGYWMSEGDKIIKKEIWK